MGHKPCVHTSAPNASCLTQQKRTCPSTVCPHKGIPHLFTYHPKGSLVSQNGCVYNQQVETCAAVAHQNLPLQTPSPGQLTVGQRHDHFRRPVWRQGDTLVITKMWQVIPIPSTPVHVRQMLVWFSVTVYCPHQMYSAYKYLIEWAVYLSLGAWAAAWHMDMPF